MGKCAACYLYYNNKLAPFCCTPDGAQWREAINKNDDSNIAFDAIFPCYDSCYVITKSYPTNTPCEMCHEVIPCCAMCDATCTKESTILQMLDCCCGNVLCCCVLLTSPVPCITLPMYRYYVRNSPKIKIEGSVGNDCVQSWLCYPCTLRLAAYTVEHPDEFDEYRSPETQNSMSSTVTNVRILPAYDAGLRWN